MTPQAAPDMPQAIRHEQGDGGRKKASNIIHDYVMSQSGDAKAAEAVMKALADLINRKVARLVQFGNTVFWATQKPNKTIDVHIFTEEEAQTLVKRIKQAYGWARDHGFQTITSTLTDPEFERLLKASGLPYSVKQTMVNNGKAMVPAYQMTMQVR